MNSKTKRITVIGMLCAITYVTMVVGRIPIILFLKYDPSDVIVTLGGFIWGPMTSCIVSVIVATLEMITVSDTGILGCIMNIVQTLSFACTASVIYKKKHTLSGAVIGLASGANNGYRYAVVELFGNAALYGVSKRSSCRIVTSCLSSI